MVCDKAKKALEKKIEKEKADKKLFVESIKYFEQGICPKCGSKKIRTKKLFFSSAIIYICKDCDFKIKDTTINHGDYYY